ncbi:MAG: hypothetical protein LQ351_000266 [Letrouitia transgressa]|nr:MAG: hypothetical protein LQ351_000266 [Letrouitia transgressa]
MSETADINIPDISTLSLNLSTTTTSEPQSEVPPHRSHDSANNSKRSDPFQFGSRYLLPDDDPYEFNAWDHVEPSAADLAHFQSQLAAQRASPVSSFDKSRFNSNPEKWWNRFYTNNTANFFKDRKWLQQEFPVLKEMTRKDAGRRRILEVGAGAGNTCFPILRGNENPELVVYACDYSSKAVQLIREAEAYDDRYVKAEVWDVTSREFPAGLEENSVDVVLMIFVFSALHPSQWKQAVSNVWRILKPGGEVCFRDYGRGDLAQVRMRKGRWMQENFYIRGDGTRVYFFGQDELKDIWGNGVFGEGTDGQDDEGFEHDAPRDKRSDVNDIITAMSSGDMDHSQNQFKETPFEILSLGVDRRLLVNRQKQLKMFRCWMQGRFRKPLP